MSVKFSTPRSERNRTLRNIEESEADIMKYNTELVSVLDEMKSKRDEIQTHVLRLTDEQVKLQEDLSFFTEKLKTVNERLCHDMIQRDRCDQMILHYNKEFQSLLIGSDSLLTNVRETVKSLIAETSCIKETGSDVMSCASGHTIG